MVRSIRHRKLHVCFDVAIIAPCPRVSETSHGHIISFHGGHGKYIPSGTNIACHGDDAANETSVKSVSSVPWQSRSPPCPLVVFALCIRVEVDLVYRLITKG